MTEHTVSLIDKLEALIEPEVESPLTSNSWKNHNYTVRQCIEIIRQHQEQPIGIATGIKQVSDLPMGDASTRKDEGFASRQISGSPTSTTNDTLIGSMEKLKDIVLDPNAPQNVAIDGCIELVRHWDAQRVTDQQREISVDKPFERYEEIWELAKDIVTAQGHYSNGEPDYLVDAHTVYNKVLDCILSLPKQEQGEMLDNEKMTFEQLAAVYNKIESGFHKLEHMMFTYMNPPKREYSKEYEELKTAALGVLMGCSPISPDDSSVTKLSTYKIRLLGEALQKINSIEGGKSDAN